MKKQPQQPVPDAVFEAVPSQAALPPAKNGRAVKRPTLTPQQKAMANNLRAIRTEALEYRRSLEGLRGQALEQAQRNMDIVLQVLKHWIHQES